MSLNNVDPKMLYEDVKQHLVSEGLKILLDEARDGFYEVKAHKGSALSVTIGAIRDVDVLITGNSTVCDVTLRTGAWGRDVAIPAVEGFIFFGILGGAAAGGASYYMAHEFEKKFWNWLREDAQRISQGKATAGSTYTPPMIPHDQRAYLNLSQPQTAASVPAYCPRCGSKTVEGATYCSSCGAKLV
ncbi:MAG: zinc-ribbon domain-containing protein [Thermoplasmata archaeon]|uniref:Zinc-ribbon domain-containing protein n=1 Tax=Candidatus Sysuiplasma superficiale TaxID=2823368 RepID=A0A8J7YX36_9ARCH|nr:zinc-ribbon domain-containing protein [Candidatus Sysuiplasma superficiale]MBX8644464.1 zinc-ribbon domain-containing protein [Candidatus Sysuiplasma superficiale]MCL4346586.1 zinc-ribbon domain-containing protein [Candidatus Thermoplasmatota archaeon]MCL5437408.1 zinc-ribbon domain-containing protein [Candidatus Thermoplasmatota archaeon]